MKTREFQTKDRKQKVTVEPDDGTGFAVVTLSEKGSKGRFKTVESVAIPGELLRDVILALLDEETKAVLKATMGPSRVTYQATVV